MKGREAYEKKLRQIVQDLPETPGCYQYLNEDGKVIYVGKAKNLKRRVSSYFIKEQEYIKTKILVSQIADIKYVVVKTEWDALLLENNLIKKYKPRYNILLKDDKTYPSVCITNEPFPRVFKTRNIIKNGSTYYGPYSHVATLNRIMELIHQLYKVRTCRLPLTAESVSKGKYKQCLEYHINNCMAPCIGEQSMEEYRAQIAEITTLLKGKVGDITQSLLRQIQQKVELLQFEEAQSLKEKYEALRTFQEKSQVVSNTIANVDVFSIDHDADIYFINYLHVENGCINQAFTFEFKKKLDETDSEILLMGIVEMKKRYKSQSSEIIVPFVPETEIDSIKWTVPQRGDKKTLLSLSELNVKQYRADRVKQMDKLNPQQKGVRLTKELQKLLNLEKAPMRIECFDNSHISGTDAVSACVVYEGGKPNKKEYRLYNIKSGVGGDDYGSMTEVMTRRYSKMIEEEKTLPDLLIVDGGKGQMSVAGEVMEQLEIHIPIAGLVKNAKHKTSGLLFGIPQMEVGVKPDSELFRMLEQMQEEVHRVAVSFHRKKRSKRQTETELTEIDGIGKTTAETLLKHFKSVKRVREAEIADLQSVIGIKKGETVFLHFHAEK